jgi:septum formation protein
VLGKPRDAAHAAEMLRLLRGREHRVITGVFLTRSDDGRHVRRTEVTRVWFKHYDERTLLAYVESGEPLDKAGAYGIQGGGAALAERVDGSWNNVVGLAVEQLPEWLSAIGLDLEALLSPNRRTSRPR